jgi:hypothetical protein
MTVWMQRCRRRPPQQRPHPHSPRAHAARARPPPHTPGLAQNRYLEDPAFLNYLKYLEYWRQPQYARYIR